jgi:hypothetical protein
LTATTGPNGAYTQYVKLYDQNLSDDLVIEYCSPANIANGASSFWYGTELSAKFGVFTAPASVASGTVDFMATDATYSSTFYFPEEPSTASEGVCTVDFIGARWNDGDFLAAYHYLTSTSAISLCSAQAGVALVLGATSLAACAGAASIAAALSI